MPQKDQIPLSYSGPVIGGKKNASAFGYPTANIAFEKKNYSGTYAGYVEIDSEKYPAALYVDPERKILEAHILGADLNLYGKKVCLEFLKKIAEKKAYRDTESMIKGVHAIIAKVRAYFAQRKES